MRKHRFLISIISLVLVGGVSCAPPSPSGGGGGGGGASDVTLTVNGEDVVFSVAAPLTVAVEPIDLATLPPVPDDVVPLADDAFATTVENVTPGAIAEVVITLRYSAMSYRKLVGGVWDPFLFDGSTGATVSADGRTITLALQDGGRGDDDGVADGRIVDPGFWDFPACWTIGAFDLAYGVDFVLSPEPSAGVVLQRYLSHDCSHTPVGQWVFAVQADDANAAHQRCLDFGAGPSPVKAVPGSNPFEPPGVPADGWFCT
jgi:hypothetical protein